MSEHSSASQGGTHSNFRGQRGMIDINNFDAVKIGLASPKAIRDWSSGEITKPETINYRTLKPERDGLFCERIFGPTKDWECACGKYKRVRYRGIICERCGVEVTRAKVRRERMGHIDLAAPVSHIWFFKGVPSRIGYMLDLAPKELEKVLYYASAIITYVDVDARERDRDELEVKVNQALEDYQTLREERAAELDRRLERRLAFLDTGDQTDFLDEDQFWLDELERDLTDEEGVTRKMADADRDRFRADLRKDTESQSKELMRYTEDATERLKAAWQTFLELTPRQTVADEQLFRELRERFGSPRGFGEYFTGGMGAGAIRELLADIDVDVETANLREQVASSKGQRRERAMKRLKVMSAFAASGNKPEWMIMDVVPVIPPEIRPMVQLDGGRFATSDLNDLYRRVINRNNRLKRLMDLGAPEIIVNNEKRMLQEAVDALFDNGRRGRAVTGPGNRPLKSLSDMLKGKQGRFRQNLLGKRVDYSGRSVIVAGPELKLHQCGLPKLMALELFKPFIMSRLVGHGLVNNIKAAKKMVESAAPEVFDALDEVISEHVVLLNRAPTLHRLGIQAFEPVLVEGKAIQIHPLVCAAFNADFDGDQMAVHLPLSVEAQAEARVLMLSSNNILSPAHGRPIAVPSQDMVLGLYYLTYSPMVTIAEKGQNEAVVDLADLWNPTTGAWQVPAKATLTLDDGTMHTAASLVKTLDAPVRVIGPERLEELVAVGTTNVQDVIEYRGAPGADLVVATAGRVLLNIRVERAIRSVINDAELGHHPFPAHYTTMTKRAIGDFVSELVTLYGSIAVSQALDALKDLGFGYASHAGITISKNDVVIPPQKQELIDQFTAEVARIEDFYADGLMTSEEKHDKVVAIWDDATDAVGEAMSDNLSRRNPIFMMANSGARGSFKQIRQLAGMRGCMVNPKGETIERPITSNFMEGLSVLEYFISTHGARKGIADTALKTADSGYLTRRLVDVAQDVIVREDDCGTTDGIWTPVMVDGAVNEGLIGRTLAGDIVDGDEVLWKFDGVVRVVGADEIAAMREVATESAQVYVRSPLKCTSTVGVCAHCYGTNLGTGRECEPGDAVGIIAAQSIGEPGTQLTMRTFHTGGVAGADITQGLPRIVELFEARKPKALALVAPADGWVRIEEDESRYGAVTLTVVEPVYLESDGEAGPIPLAVHTFTASSRSSLRVTDGQFIEAGEIMTAGSAYPVDILDAVPGVCLHLGGTVERVGKPDADGWQKVSLVDTLGEKHTRMVRLPSDRDVPLIAKGMEIGVDERLLSHEQRMRERSTRAEKYMVREVQQVYRSQGVDIDDKHIELIVRQMLRKVKITDSGTSPFIPGQLVERALVLRENARIGMEALAQLHAKKEAGEWKGSDREAERLVAADQVQYEPLLLGITKASLATESFLSAASFQETTKVLTDAAIDGRVDSLRGLKENVIIGKLIPAATGLPRYRRIEVASEASMAGVEEIAVEALIEEEAIGALFGPGEAEGDALIEG